MASGSTPLPPFPLVKPAFGFAAFVTVPLLSVSKCLRIRGRDSAVRTFFIPPRILGLHFKTPLRFFFLLTDHHFLNAQIHFSKTRLNMDIYVCP